MTFEANPARLISPEVVKRADQLIEGDVVVLHRPWGLGNNPTMITCVDTVKIHGDDAVVNFTVDSVGEITTSVGNTFVVLANSRLGRDLNFRV